jgi:NAD(P)-dependent dehydrogenase (short-subunit alcohol dehydrogenase family)
MKQRLAGKVAIVTGSSRGIGKAIALELAHEGAALVVAARTVAKGQGSLPGSIYETVEEINSFGGQAIGISCDVSQEEQVQDLMKQTEMHYGKVDILINNAGIATPESFLSLPTKKWDLVIAVNLKGTYLCTKAVLPGMIARNSGHIINMSSVLARRSTHSIPYGVSKAAIERFTVGLARELKGYGIAVNALCPDFTKTEAALSLTGDADTNNWQSPEMWGRYAVLVSVQNAESLTGRILDEETLKKLVG